MVSHQYRRHVTTLAAEAVGIAMQCYIIKTCSVVLKSKVAAGRRGRQTRQRHRRTIEQVYECLGPQYFKRAYRMSYESFMVLHSKIEDRVIKAIKEIRSKWVRSKGKRTIKLNQRSIPNGCIPTSTRLACALRYFAGASPYDLCTTFCVSHTDVFDSIWAVIEAVNGVVEFHIQYPECHSKQQQIADEFRAKSMAGFDNCGGAIDGILIWTEKPPKKEARRVGVDQLKFFCARKHKFGMNCQAVSNAHGRFLDISIVYGGATSDCLAFEGSHLFRRLGSGLMKTGLCLYGDNAYINEIFMATPYPNVSNGPKDDYNFFQSQLRIQVECAFGKFTRRWGILCSALPAAIKINKVVALVNALAKLHNFCIDRSESIEDPTPTDFRNVVFRGSGHVPLDSVRGADVQIPRQIIGGGHHFADMPRNFRRVDSASTQQFPREILLNRVVNGHFRRPRSLEIRS